MDKSSKNLEESYTSYEDEKVGPLRPKVTRRSTRAGRASKYARSLTELFDSMAPPPQEEASTAGDLPAVKTPTSTSEDEQSDTEIPKFDRWNFPEGNYHFAEQVYAIFWEISEGSKSSKPLLWDHGPENSDLFHENALMIKDEERLQAIFLKTLWAQRGEPMTLEVLEDATSGDTAWEKVYATRMAFYEYDLMNELLIKMCFPQAKLDYRSREEEALDWFKTCDTRMNPWAMEKLLKLQGNPNTTQTKLSLIDRELEEVDQQLDYFDQCYSDWHQQAESRKASHCGNRVAWKQDWTEPIPLTLHAPWKDITDIDVLKTACVFEKLRHFIHTKRNAFINIQTMMEKVMDKLEIQHHRLDIAQDLKTALEKDQAHSEKVEHLNYYKDNINMTPPEVLQFYQWKNVKTNTRKFGNAEFRFDSKRGCPKQLGASTLDAELLIFPTVKQMMSKGNPDDALYVKLKDVKRMLKPLGYNLDEGIEHEAQTEAKSFISNLRTHVPAGHKLYPIPGKTCLKMLCATLDFEKTLSPEEPVPDVSFNEKFNIVHATQDRPYKQSSKINDSFVLQRAISKGSSETKNESSYFPLREAKAIINDPCPINVWLGPSVNPDRPDFELGTQEDLLQNWPNSVWQKQNPDFTWRHWNQAMIMLSRHDDCVLDKQSMIIICRAFGTLCKFLWRSHVGRLEENSVNTPDYSFKGFKRLLSVMELGTHKRNVIGARHLAERYGGSLVCAHCQSVDRLMTRTVANCQQICAKYAQEAQVTEMNNQALWNHHEKQAKVRLEIDVRNLLNLRRKVRSVEAGKFLLTQELSILAAQVLIFNKQPPSTSSEHAFKFIYMPRLIMDATRHLTPEDFESATKLTGSIQKVLNAHFHSKEYADEKLGGSLDDVDASPSKKNQQE